MAVVLDCNIYIQSLLSTRGAAYGCWEAVCAGLLMAYATESILEEVARVTEYPSLRKKRLLSHGRVERFMASVRQNTRIVSEPPNRFGSVRDPDDVVYVNLALQTDCRWIVSRDRDLLDLMLPHTPDGEALRKLSPELRVVDPETMLLHIRTTSGHA